MGSMILLHNTPVTALASNMYVLRKSLEFLFCISFQYLKDSLRLNFM